MNNPNFLLQSLWCSATLHFELTPKKLWHRNSSSATPWRVMVKTSWSTFRSRFKKKNKQRNCDSTTMCFKCIHLIPAIGQQTWQQGKILMFYISRLDGRCWEIPVVAGPTTSTTRLTETLKVGLFWTQIIRKKNNQNHTQHECKLCLIEPREKKHGLIHHLFFHLFFGPKIQHWSSMKLMPVQADEPVEADVHDI